MISTHALTWSATIDWDDELEINIISTHALTWSATGSINHLLPRPKFQLTHSRGVRPYEATMKIRKINFNSRTHVECDNPTSGKIGCVGNFNSRTHVECDHKYLDCFSGIDHFNSRTHVECDCDRHSAVCRPALFQLTHSRGVRRAAAGSSLPGLRFQLTHSRGVRLRIF